MLNLKEKISKVFVSCLLLIFAGSLPAWSNPMYETARDELPEEWYILYRIAEKLSRANNLDDFPWRVQIHPEYTINAHASENNLVVLDRGILEQIYGDFSAIACVVGHEMAHHSSEHISEQNLSALQWQRELLSQVESEQEREQLARQLINDFGLNISVNELLRDLGPLRNVARDLLDGVSIPVLGDIFGRPSNSREQVNEAFEELQSRRLEQRLEHEFEADRIGFEYATRAGFEPEGCVRLMRILARGSGSRTSLVHPNIEQRIEALQGLIQSNQTARLIAEGQENMTNKPSLSYQVVSDNSKTWLRINSRFGSAGQDLERVLGE